MIGWVERIHVYPLGHITQVANIAGYRVMHIRHGRSTVLDI